MDAGMDTGPMLLKAYSPIALFDNAEQVGATLGQMGADHTPHPTPHTPHPTPHFLEKKPGLKLFDRCLRDFCDRG
jgi:hypothetical protein